jgi:peptidoglycan L-alanyl-D-glutamate endopeptidase CwlK
MPFYSGTSMLKLQSCHEDLRAIFNEVIKHYNCTIVCGHRNEKDQAEAFNAGKSKAKWPLSLHNHVPSLAIDAMPYPVDYTDLDRLRTFAGYVLGIAQLMLTAKKTLHLVRWGGDWDMDTQVKDNNFNDLGHFELVEVLDAS